MTKADVSAEIVTAQFQDLETLQRRLSELAHEADAATQTYDRTAWIRYAAIWIPIPFLVLLFRVHMQAWHYYVAGALFVVVSLVMYVVDLAAVEKRDETVEAAQRALEAYEAARMSQRHAA
jgi:hypothetical protein